MQIANIYRKELLDVLRDRKTLLFMLGIPALAMPLMIFGSNRLVMNLQKKQAVEKVTVAATAQSQAAYRDLLFDWFKASKMGKVVWLQEVAQRFAKTEERSEHDPIPRDVLTDSIAFGEWVRDMADKARVDVEEADFEDMEADPDGELEGFETPGQARKAAMDFYNVVFKGYGLIDFVEPSTLETKPDSALAGSLSEELQGLADAAVAAAAIKAREIHGYLHVPDGTEELRDATEGGAGVVLLHDSTIRLSGEAEDRFDEVTDELSDSIVAARLRKEKLPSSFLTPLWMARGADVATDSEKVFYLIGAILPYIIIAFAFLGGMYPAIDLGAGEKERGTLETLVLSPATRTEIALGKFLVILTSALTAAFLGVASIALSIRYIAPQALLDKLDLDLPVSTIIPVVLLTIPPAAAFSGLFLAISIYARSFKEAQNYIAPLQFILILPAMAPMLPGFEISWTVAAIPLVNVSMISKELLKGDVNWGYYALTCASCLAAAGLCIAFAIAQFRKEEVLFRS